MVKYIVVFFAMMTLPVSASAQLDARRSSLQLQVLYDNVPASKNVATDWGFACLITGKEKSVLFDTGAKGSILLANMKAMKVEPRAVDAVVISHAHGDHTGGLQAFLRECPGVSVYLPISAARSMVDSIRAASRHCEVVTKRTDICQGVTVLGPIGTRIVEQSLVVDTPQGLVVVTGCSHPGIVEMTRQAKASLKQDIYMVCGGMHMSSQTEQQVKKQIAELKRLGVKKVGATHCTGDAAVRLFREAFGDNYVPLGAGRTVTLP